MPEEKVSQQECRCPPAAKYHVYGCALDGEPLAADAGPRQPDSCSCEECASRLATAPDSAMRASQDLFDRGYWSAKSTEPAPTQKAQVPHVAALIREAGSERERRLLNWFIKYAEDAEKSWTKDGERTVTAMSWGQAVSEFRAEASRLLGGKSK